MDVVGSLIPPYVSTICLKTSFLLLFSQHQRHIRNKSGSNGYYAQNSALPYLTNAREFSPVNLRIEYRHRTMHQPILDLHLLFTQHANQSSLPNAPPTSSYSFKNRLPLQNSFFRSHSYVSGPSNSSCKQVRGLGGEVSSCGSIRGIQHREEKSSRPLTTERVGKKG